MLASASHAVVGSGDPRRMAQFFEGYGFHVKAESLLPASSAAHLYGLGAEVLEIALWVPGTTTGGLRIVETPVAPRPRIPFQLGPTMLDIYTRDVAASLDIADDAGEHVGPAVRYSVVGYSELTEGQSIGPDGLAIGWVDAPGRHPSILDSRPEAVHSELHALVWTVRSIDQSAPFWQVEAGLHLVLDTVVSGSDIPRFMELPRDSLRMRITHLADAAVNPVRFELMEFPDELGPTRELLPLRPGLHAPAFAASHLEASMEGLPSATWGPITELNTLVHPSARAVVGIAPGDVAFELWEELT